MTNEEIATILDLHKKWLRGEEGGVQAERARWAVYAAIDTVLRGQHPRRFEVALALATHAHLVNP